MSDKDRFGDFTGIREIMLPVSLAPREGKYYGTEIIDARGALVVDLWEHGENATPSDREKAYFGPDWSEEAWSEYCCDSHWECQEDYLFALFLIKVLNYAMNPFYAGLEPRHKYAINRFSIGRSAIDSPEDELRTWLQISGIKNPEPPEVSMSTARHIYELSDEDIVLESYPDAYAHFMPSKGWQIRRVSFAIMRRVTYQLSGWRKTKPLAWADALHRIMKAK